MGCGVNPAVPGKMDPDKAIYGNDGTMGGKLDYIIINFSFKIYWIYHWHYSPGLHVQSVYTGLGIPCTDIGLSVEIKLPMQWTKTFNFSSFNLIFYLWYTAHMYMMIQSEEPNST